MSTGAAATSEHMARKIIDAFIVIYMCSERGDDASLRSVICGHHQKYLRDLRRYDIYTVINEMNLILGHTRASSF